MLFANNDMMDYIECADANGYDVDDNFNLVSREESNNEDINRTESTKEKEDIFTIWEKSFKRD